MIIVVDDEDRENEGDLTIAAEKVTPEAINFMATHGRGLICLSMTPERLDELEIPLMVSQNTSRFETAFCVPIEAKARTTHRHLRRRSRGDGADGDRSGDAAVRSRAARATCSRCARAPAACMVRAGQTEAAVDLARIAGLYPAGVICEIMNEDGTMARVPRTGEVREEARAADDHDRGSDQVPDAHRVAGEAGRIGEAADRVRRLPRCTSSTTSSTGRTHVALVRGDIGDGKDVLVRVHSQCLTGDVLHSIRCDCGAQLEAAMERIAAEGRGVLLYLNQEGRGIGLANKIRAYELQDEGFDTVEANERLGFKADQRDYGMGVADSARPRRQVDAAAEQQPAQAGGHRGLRPVGVSEWLPLEIPASESTRRYLKTKKDKLGHKLSASV